MKKRLLLMFLSLAICSSAFGQFLVKGKVVTEDGHALPGATVQIQGTTKGVVTDVDGNFEIKVDSKEEVLIFRFINHEEVKVKASKARNKVRLITLKPSPNLYPLKCYHPHTPLSITYWPGLGYNPYGIAVSKGWHYRSWTSYFFFDLGYSTNFEENADFYGKVGTEILRRRVFYKFQQTRFNTSDTENQITTHLLTSESYLRFIRSEIVYGLGHQTFRKEDFENSTENNFGLVLGLKKDVRYVGSLSAECFYWQDYWGLEANWQKDFFIKNQRFCSGITCRKTEQLFEEVNLSLGLGF